MKFSRKRWVSSPVWYILLLLVTWNIISGGKAEARRQGSKSPAVRVKIKGTTNCRPGYRTPSEITWRKLQASLPTPIWQPAVSGGDTRGQSFKNSQIMPLSQSALRNRAERAWLPGSQPLRCARSLETGKKIVRFANVILGEMLQIER